MATRLLMPSEADYPGWRAPLDGGEIPIIYTNVAFRGLQTPAGRYRVEFVFRPEILWWPAAIRLLSQAHCNSPSRIPQRWSSTNRCHT